MRVKAVLIILATYALLLLATVGCQSGARVVFVPDSGIDPQTGKRIILRAGPDVSGKVYTWNGKEWELSAKASKIPEGWLLHSDAPEAK